MAARGLKVNLLLSFRSASSAQKPEDLPLKVLDERYERLSQHLRERA